MKLPPPVGHYTARKGSDPGGAHRIGYRSPLELRVMQVIDASPDVDVWEYETLDVPYLETVTKPDFVVQMVDGTGRLVEAKGRAWMDASVGKIEAARAWCDQHGALYFLVTEGAWFAEFAFAGGSGLPLKVENLDGPWFAEFAYIKGSPAYLEAFSRYLVRGREKFGPRSSP